MISGEERFMERSFYSKKKALSGPMAFAIHLQINWIVLIMTHEEYLSRQNFRGLKA